MLSKVSLCEKVKEYFINLFKKEKKNVNKKNLSDKKTHLCEFENDIFNDGDGPIWF